MIKGNILLVGLTIFTGLTSALLVPETSLILSGTVEDDESPHEAENESFSNEELTIFRAALNLGKFKSKNNSSDKLPSKIIIHEGNYECGTEQTPKSYIDYIRNDYEPDVEDEKVSSGLGKLVVPDTQQYDKGLKQKIKDKFTMKSIQEENTTIYVLNGTAIELAITDN